MRRLRDDAGLAVEEIGGARHDPVVGLDEPGGDGRLRPRPRLEMAPLHQQPIGPEPLPIHHHVQHNRSKPAGAGALRYTTTPARRTKFVKISVAERPEAASYRAGTRLTPRGTGAPLPGLPGCRPLESTRPAGQADEQDETWTRRGKSN